MKLLWHCGHFAGDWAPLTSFHSGVDLGQGQGLWPPESVGAGEGSCRGFTKVPTSPGSRDVSEGSSYLLLAGPCSWGCSKTTNSTHFSGHVQACMRHVKKNSRTRDASGGPWLLHFYFSLGGRIGILAGKLRGWFCLHPKDEIVNGRWCSRTSQHVVALSPAPTPHPCWAVSIPHLYRHAVCQSFSWRRSC